VNPEHGSLFDDEQSWIAPPGQSQGGLSQFRRGLLLDIGYHGRCIADNRLLSQIAL
jgi:hypothetical protein